MGKLVVPKAKTDPAPPDEKGPNAAPPVPPEPTPAATEPPLTAAPLAAKSTTVALAEYDPATQIVVNRKLFNKMCTTLILNKGLFLYTGQGFTTQLGELLGLKKDDPGFYQKAQELAHSIIVEHQRGQ